MIEEAMKKTEVDTGRRYNVNRSKSGSRFILYLNLAIPIPRSDKLPNL